MYSKHDMKDSKLVYVLSEFNTETDDEKELARDKDVAELLKKVPEIEKAGGYDGGVVIDLSSPIE